MEQGQVRSPCPEHPDTEMRIEYGPQGFSGFCSKCLKHHHLCLDEADPMTHCMLHKGHLYEHMNGSRRWT